MLTTKAFADLCDTTKRTIVHYDRIGLLKPAGLDNQNRLYEPKQVLVFQKIVLLKSFGLKLSQIKPYLNANKALKKLFSSQKLEIVGKRQTLEKRINKISEFLSNLNLGKPMVVPKIKTVKPYVFYGLNKIGRYVDIDKHQRELFAKIGDTKYKQIGLTVFYNNKYSPQKANMTTGVLVKGKSPKKIDQVQSIKVPSYKAVSYTHIGPYSYMSYVWQFLDKYVKDNKLKPHPAIACREFYIIGGLTKKPEDKYVTELQVPII